MGSWLQSGCLVQQECAESIIRYENELMVTRLARTNLVHLEQRTLAHLLQRTDFSCFLFPSKVDLPVTSLSNLGNDMELFDPQLSPSTPQQNAFASTVRLKFLSMLGRR